MQTIKTAVVVVLLLFVLYGGYMALNGTDTPLRPELEALVPLDQDIPDVAGTTGPFVSTGTSSNSASAFDQFNSTPAPSFGAPSGTSTTSPFASTFNNSGSSEPAATLPSSLNSLPNGGLPDTTAPLLTPSTGSNAPALPTFPASNSADLELPSLPPLPGGSSSETKTNDLSNISTSSPSFNVNTPTKVSAELTSNAPSAGSSFGNKSPTFEDAEKDLGLSESDLSSSPNTSLPIAPTSASKSYENAKELAMEQIDRGNLKEALATLSVFYNAPELTSEQRTDLLDLLDALTREVVYSRRHLLDMPYIIVPGETLDQVAKRYDVPTEILARINAVEASSQLPASTKLKVVPGPFRAEVDLTRNELTVFVGDLYAGRYPISLGNDPAPQPGVFTVGEKQRNRNYYGNGVQIPYNDPRNPYGGWWIDLGQDMCIHGTAENAPSGSKLGCISLSPNDASDIFGMLGRGSQVTIRK